MSEEELELLITLDDPVDAQQEDIFNHLQARNTFLRWFGKPFTAWERYEHRAETAVDNDAYTVSFGQGDWTCTLTRLKSTATDFIKGLNTDISLPAGKKLEIEVCTVARWQNGEVVEQKTFYDLVALLKQFISPAQ